MYEELINRVRKYISRIRKTPDLGDSNSIRPSYCYAALFGLTSYPYRRHLQALAGGGSAYIHASKEVAKLAETLEGDEKTGAQLVLKALEAHCYAALFGLTSYPYRRHLQALRVLLP